MPAVGFFVDPAGLHPPSGRAANMKLTPKQAPAAADCHGVATDEVGAGFTHHNIVHLDSVALLLEKGAPEAAFPLLRSMLESYLGIAHIVEAQSNERTLAYKLSRIMRTIQSMRIRDTNHPEGKKLSGQLANDGFMAGLLEKTPNALG
jgi:hypothetical protein